MLFNYLLYIFFLLTTVVPMAALPLMNNRAIHSARLLLSPACGELESSFGLLLSPVCGDLESSFSFAVTMSAF